MRLFSLFLCSCLTFFSCKENDREPNEQAETENIWLDYRVWGDEESGFVTVKAQFRTFGSSGKALRLAPPSNIKLDGKALEFDSTRMNGGYYERIIPAHEFEGRHILSFTDINKKEFKEEFEFQPLSLDQALPEMIDQGDLEIMLDGVTDRDRVRVIIMDTTAFSEGIDRVDTVLNGRIKIDSIDLAGLSPGPIFLELVRERDRRIKNTPGRGGRISISFSLKRQVFLIQ